MKNFKYLTIIAFFIPLGAYADMVILKDTRKIDIYTQSITQVDNCTQDYLCHEEKSLYIKEGEMLTYNPEDHTCTSTIWHQLKRNPLYYQGHDVSAPNMQASEKVYRCQADGTPAH